MSNDLMLYKLIEKYADYGWSGDEFYICVYLVDVDVFIEELRSIVGDERFSDDGMVVRIQLDRMYIDEFNLIFDEYDFVAMFKE